MKHSGQVPEDGCPQVDAFNHTGQGTYFDYVSYPVLVLQQYEKTGEKIFDDALCPEAYGNTDDTGAGQQGSDVDS